MGRVRGRVSVGRLRDSVSVGRARDRVSEGRLRDRVSEGRVRDSVSVSRNQLLCRFILTPSVPRRFSYTGNYEQYKYNTDIYTKRK